MRSREEFSYVAKEAGETACPTFGCLNHPQTLRSPGWAGGFAKRRFGAYLICFAAFAVDKPASSDEVKTRLPALTSVYPQGWTAGAKVPVTVLGEYLDRTEAVIFLDASIRGRVVESSFTRLALEFDVDPQAPLGPHYFRTSSPRGAS